MTTVTDIINDLGSPLIERECQVSEYSVRAAKREQSFPASWYRIIRRLREARGRDCPLDLFNFKQDHSAVVDGLNPSHPQHGVTEDAAP